MIICIPTEDERGVESKAHGHFGSAPYFTVVDINEGRPEVLSKPDCQHAAQHTHHLDQLQARDVDAVVCEGMGRRALAALNRQGIEGLSTACGKVGDIVEAVRVGNFHRLTPLEAYGAAHREYGRGAGVGRGPRRRHGHGHRRGRAAARTRTEDQE